MSDGQHTTIPILIELPAYGYTFTVILPSSEANNVLSIKEAIFRTCPGNPRVDGQRIIWRGRVLDNVETVADLWPESNDDLRRIVHLSVHPSAWTGMPPIKETSREAKGKEKEKEMGNVINQLRSAAATPSLKSSSTASVPTLTASKSAPTPTPRSSSSPTSTSTALPAYILSKHRQALSALTHEPFTPSDNDKESAVQFVNAHGFVWPDILDAQFPNLVGGSEKGLRYQKEVIDGRPYLRLLDPSVSPTSVQRHAFHVLSYTMELLKLSPLKATPTSSTSSTSQPQVNQQGVQFDLNQFLNGNNNANPANPHPPIQIQQINLRPLILPILMLSLRTLLLLYFVAPARKPFLTLLILAWVGWEIWGWIGGLGLRVEGENQAGNIGRGGDAGEGAGQAGVAQPPPMQNAPAPAPNGPPAIVPGNNNNNAAHHNGIIETLASFDIADGESALSSFLPESDLSEPGFPRKALSFLVLLFTTVHPAVWNRRRTLLRAREGRVKVEMNVLREGAEEVRPVVLDEGNFNDRRAERRAEMLARYMRRPSWVRRYMQRVMNAEGEGVWVDEAD
ncbi:hypothetical protein J3R30DRAFT_3298632 [Lentinula aciculospora]|uniref:Ubiquitin-like domain-containing protein n=1 Tax=Lentinula aciculospora TaxID=153920 RepID=A0A9W9DJE9_9AGAR|nr:hypothetical protein J3R30DRAFT_3298632 [Lentinula aciculospora]